MSDAGGGIAVTEPVPAAQGTPPMAGGRALSLSQQSVWRAEMLYPGTPRWTQVAVVRLLGPVDADRLEAAVTAAFDRYPALRTRLVLQDGVPRQHFAPPGHLRVQRRHLPEGREQEALDAYLADAATERLALYDSVLCRPVLLLGAGITVLVLHLHHIAIDGHGGSVLSHRIAALYRGDVPFPDTPVPSAPVPGTAVPDTAVATAQSPVYEQWLDREARGVPDLEAALAFFRGTLAGAVAHTDALYDGPDEGAFHEPPNLPESTCTLDLPATRAVQRFARVTGATPFLVFFAAFAALLSEAVASDDLLVATFVSGRHGQPEELVGMCINTVLVRVRLSGRRDGPGFVAAVKAAWSPVRRFQNVPLLALAQAEGGIRPSRAQFAINYLDMAHVPFEVPGIATQVTHAQQGYPPNDLLFYILREQDGRTRMRLINGSGTPALSQQRVAALLATFVAILTGWVQAPPPDALA